MKCNQARRDTVVQALWVKLQVLNSLQSLMIVAKKNMSAQQSDQRKVTKFEVQVATTKFVGNRIWITWNQHENKFKSLKQLTFFANSFQLFVNLRFLDQRIENVQDWVNVPNIIGLVKLS